MQAVKDLFLFLYPHETPDLFNEGGNFQHMENKQVINISSAVFVAEI